MIIAQSQSQIVQELKRRQGKLTATEFAAELGISAAYWSLLRRGLREPGPKLLKALKLKKVYVSADIKGNGKGSR